jgi:spore coat polysaccharide biosynthesis predicted glycosyltransferase SpsG
MIGFCLEASHARGLGHLFKVLNLTAALARRGEPCLVMVNPDPNATAILAQRSVGYATVDLADTSSDWESALIVESGITVWVNDRLDTSLRHAENVKRNGIKLVTFDDRGTGAALADLHFAPLAFSDGSQLRGKRVLTGIQYLALNDEIAHHRRVRTQLKSPILVTLGGSDTYGVTLSVVAQLKKLDRPATVVTGPSFQHARELERALDDRFTWKQGVPSLIQEFYHHDLAITGGGVTPFEANASGLPCIIIANEPHEIACGQYLEGLGCSIFAGYYQEIAGKVFEQELDLTAMSQAGIEQIKTTGVENILRELAAL